MVVENVRTRQQFPIFWQKRQICIHQQQTCSLMSIWGKKTFNQKIIIQNAKSQEPGNQVSGHFWSEIQIFLRNQSIKYVELNKMACIVRMG